MCSRCFKFNLSDALRQASLRRAHLFSRFSADKQNRKSQPVSRRLFITDGQQWWETRYPKLSSECEVVVRICCFAWLITRPSDFRYTQRYGFDSSRTRCAPISKIIFTLYHLLLYVATRYFYTVSGGFIGEEIMNICYFKSVAFKKIECLSKKFEK